MSKHTGRPKGSARLYAEELGISRDLLRRLGGEEHLRSLPEDSRALLIKPENLPKSRTVKAGGMAARGWKTCVKGVDSR